MDGTLSMRCEHPFMKGGRYPYDCCRCVECRVKRASRWAQKLELELIAAEDRTGDYSSFVTLTYDDLFLPETGLRKRDVQLYLKRLRKAVSSAGGPQFRVGYCGEYGGRFGRPHYHALVFGLNPYACGELFRTSWRDPDTGVSMGHVDVKVAEAQRCAYMTKDMVKWLSKGDVRLDGREPCFIVGPCSQAGGLGAGFARKLGRAQVSSAATRGDVLSEFRIGRRTVWLDRTLKRHAREAAGLDPAACSAIAAAEYRQRCEVAEVLHGRVAWRTGLVQTDHQRNLQRATRRKIFAKGASL